MVCVLEYADVVISDWTPAAEACSLTDYTAAQLFISDVHTTPENSLFNPNLQSTVKMIHKLSKEI